MKHFYLTAITVLVVNLMSMAQNQGWGTVYVEWNPTTIYYTGGVQDKYDDELFDIIFNASLSMGYSRTFALSKSIPIYFEAGAAAQFMYRSESDDEYREKRWTETINMLSLKVPANIMYRFHIPNSTIDIIPYTGITLRVNLWGNYNFEEGIRYSKSYNIFSDKDMSHISDYNRFHTAWKRFQMGWQIGARAHFNNKFVVGAAFGIDLLEITMKHKMRSGNFMIGYKF
ncbi:MAG: outer membrane beta-barrel protein [Muribaculaceae bacterium]|nr:outer membrane beta-barrel protein [Muribaculaceae bacterium]MBQ5408280.1 outer membrane beta-barrel protein [Muribaculaceae bacterium]MDY6412782.1 hypothetical protein [Bacteroidales bacterium]